MPERNAAEDQPVRSFWSGTITFGLVSIPVDLFAAVRSRDVSLRLVDGEGRAVGREFYCPEDDKALSADDLVRGHPSDDGGMLVVTDEELEAIAPQMSRDIELRRFVPRGRIPPVYFDRPYYLAPAGRSTKAYHLLAETMEATQRAGIGTFVMRGHEYLVAILAEGGILRAETLRFAPELRSAEDVGLPKLKKGPKARVAELRKAIATLQRKELSREELADDRAELLQALVERKLERGKDVVEIAPADAADEEPGGEVLDLMRVLKERIGGKPRATRPAGGEELGELSKSELYERAKELDIEGRSSMSKPQLIRAIRRAS